MNDEYEPLHFEVFKFRGNVEGVTSILNTILKTLPSCKNGVFTLKLDLKEVQFISKQEGVKQ